MYMYVYPHQGRWRVRDQKNGISRAGFTTEDEAKAWRDAERSARNLPLIDDRAAYADQPAQPSAPPAPMPMIPQSTIAHAPAGVPLAVIPRHGSHVEGVLRVPADRPTLVLADFHCPLHDARAIEVALMTAYRDSGGDFNIAIIGDIFDLAEISRHPKDEREEHTTTTLRVGGEVLQAIVDYVNPRRGKVYILPGNHDRRFARATGIPFAMDDLLALAFKPNGIPPLVNISNLDYMIIDHADPRRRWTIGHPRNYSRQGGFTAARLAQRLQTNVITAHDHTVGEQMSEDGRWRGMSCGHMTIPDRHNYKHASLSLHREWSAGFVVVTDGDARAYRLT